MADQLDLQVGQVGQVDPAAAVAPRAAEDDQVLVGAADGLVDQPARLLA